MENKVQHIQENLPTPTLNSMVTVHYMLNTQNTVTYFTFKGFWKTSVWESIHLGSWQHTSKAEGCASRHVLHTLVL